MVPEGWPEGWPLPNYENPHTRGSPGLFIATLVITTVIVVLRFYSRHYITRSLGLDDGLILAGFVLSIGQTYAECRALKTWGWNKHLWDIPIDKMEYVRLGAWLVEVFFLLGNGCTKVSILLVYRKISSRTHSYWFIRLTWGAIAFTIAYTVALVLEVFLVCRPLESYWKSYDPTYTRKYVCGDEGGPLIFSAAASVFSDVYSSVLPMLLTRKLKLSQRQRFSLYALFSAGLVTAAVGVARMVFFVKVTMNYKLGPHTHDVTWYGWPTYALTDIEAHLAIICASAPALKVFVKAKCRPSRQMPGLDNAFIRSNIARRASARPWPINADPEASIPCSPQSEGPLRDQPSLTPSTVLPSPTATDHDEENFSLHSLDLDKSLTSHYPHVPELHQNETRQWPG
ncbi:hypothetical protein A1O1_03348 [Capronia coronata CBS 617.96]|uniref:Rhodopsin domain-containing protein n=1 Tax=Capronia coronata CBS 617.96 TaxID=1182541 RepID=W9Z6V4_9EURO|nr:uncharacterized protein A1O1_03348 [Capronia coronata CBS 617.96]EXJ90249.1 hypothetical protein A1O1_03348 [Capronia coronata CBS 617.96]